MIFSISKVADVQFLEILVGGLIFLEGEYFLEHFSCFVHLESALAKFFAC